MASLKYYLVTLLITAFMSVDAQVCGAMIDTSDLVYHPYEIYSVVATKAGKNEVVFTIRAVRDIEFCGLTQEDLKGLHAHHSDIQGACSIADTSYFYETYAFEKGAPVLLGSDRILPDRHLEQFLTIVEAEGMRQTAFKQFNQQMREAHRGILKARNDAKANPDGQKKAAGRSHDHTSDVIH